MGRRAPAERPGATADDALWVACLSGLSRCSSPVARAARLLAYLEVFPLGRHNRAVAEAVELCLDGIDDGVERRAITARLRSLRDPHFPPVVRVPFRLGAAPMSPA